MSLGSVPWPLPGSFVPLVVFFSRRQRPAAIDYSALHDLTILPRSVMTRLREALPLLRALVLVLCVTALAHPQQGLEATKIRNFLV